VSSKILIASFSVGSGIEEHRGLECALLGSSSGYVKWQPPKSARATNKPLSASSVKIRSWKSFLYLVHDCGWVQPKDFNRSPDDRQSGVKPELCDSVSAGTLASATPRTVERPIEQTAVCEAGCSAAALVVNCLKKARTSAGPWFFVAKCTGVQMRANGGTCFGNPRLLQVRTALLVGTDRDPPQPFQHAFQTRK